MARPRFLLPAGALAALLLAGTAFAQPDPVPTRKEGLRRMQTNLEAIGAVANAGGDTRDTVPRSDEMVAFFRNLPALFPSGSDGNGSRARPAVWSDRAGFERAATNAVAAAEALRVSAGSGDAAATSQAVRAMGGACSACHRSYRSR
ncbi:c-type cytochrome [Roseomonas xinghualingensis]|uniref:c-type cytochrome n=1 Tax=Roseomonas xinghualingensis TaxID=2986475 RepID=UPI0021F0B73E|nr:cytochrome c [Roseomonas sp. SXEYE001]MCV4207502.1 cytochrome c [Roseomonas sp. SXEYE001]